MVPGDMAKILINNGLQAGYSKEEIKQIFITVMPLLFPNSYVAMPDKTTKHFNEYYSRILKGHM